MSNLGLEDEKSESKPKQKKAFYQKNPLSGNKTFGEWTADFKRAASHVQRFQREYKTADEIPDWEVPNQFDWRNQRGYDFTGNLRDQAECGSCYTNAFIQVTESRMKVKYAHEHINQPDLSI